jgi:hypothetical protein
MIRDTLRALLTVAVLAVAAGLLVETRFQLAAIDVAHRHAIQTSPAPFVMAQQPEQGRLRKFGRATLDLADAALGIVR